MKQIYFLLIIAFFTFNSFGQTKNPPKYHLNSTKLKSLLVKKQAEFDYFSGVDTTRQGLMINFNPILLDYSKASSLRIKQDIEELSNATYFTVYLSDKLLSEQELWKVKSANTIVDLTNRVVVNGKETIPYEGGKLDSPTLNSYTKTFDSRNKANNATTFIEFGNFSGKEKKPSNGVLAELLIYNSVLRNKAKQAIETALALKYGITLVNGKDYLSTDKKVIFKVEDASLYVNRIAGIGKDDSVELNQKQSQSTQIGNVVTIGAGSIYKSNLENPSIIENQNFLVWGDNNAALTQANVNENLSLPILQRKWLIKASGEKVSEISTQIQFEAKSIFNDLNLDVKRYLLVIDKSGNGTFLPENIIYISASKIENGIITFDNVKWDTDKSGADIFSFGVSPSLEATLAESKPEYCDNGDNGVLDYTVIGGVSPYTFELQKDNQVIYTWSSKDNLFPSNKISKLGTANYKLFVTDIVGTKKEVTYRLNNPTAVTVSLGEDKRFGFEQKEMELEPIVSTTSQQLIYQWTSDKGFSSNAIKAIITEPATYNLSVTTEKGCSTNDSIVVNPNYVSSFILYPNESTDGNYDILVILTEPQDFTIQVFDIAGRLISTSKANNKSECKIHGKKINAKGVFDVVIFNEKFKIAKRLIVK